MIEVTEKKQSLAHKSQGKSVGTGKGRRVSRRDVSPKQVAWARVGLARKQGSGRRWDGACSVVGVPAIGDPTSFPPRGPLVLLFRQWSKPQRDRRPTIAPLNLIVVTSHPQTGWWSGYRR
jgi:hypothetical protein